MPDIPQRLAAIVAADIAGYTRLMELDEAGTVAAWRRARTDVIDPTVAHYHGRIVKLTGDGFLAEFPTAENAVRAALAMQAAFAELFSAMPAQRRVAFRFGVNLGDIWVDAEDIYGTGVNIAARLEALAVPGGVCISGAVHDAVKHKIAAHYENLGAQRVKNIAEPIRVWSVANDAPATMAHRVKPSRAPRRLAVYASVTAVALVSGGGYWLATRGAEGRSTATVTSATDARPAPVARQSIAVLPFDNQSAAQENAEFFADGIHNEILVQLTKIGALKVVSRTSVLEYRNTRKNLREIGHELGVATVLEGSVQRAGDIVVIHAQLIDATTDQHLWADSYTFALTPENALTAQRDMATAIARTLEATLSPQEVARLSVVPTDSARAYDLYMSGNELIFRVAEGPEALAAVDFYERALAEDPDFALAAANLSLARTWARFSRTDVSAANLDAALTAAQRALELQPGLPEAHRALGHYYLWGIYDYEQALAELTTAEAGLPGDQVLLRGKGRAYSELGRYDEALATLERAQTLDPRNLIPITGKLSILVPQRRYAEALREVERAIEIAPNTFWAHSTKATIPLMAYGDSEPLRRLAAQPPTIGVTAGERQNLLYQIAGLDGDYARQLQMLKDGLFQATGVAQPASTYGKLYTLLDEPELAREQFETMIRQLTPIMAEQPNNGIAHSGFARALLGVGQRERALEAARHAAEIFRRNPGPSINRFGLLVLSDAFWLLGEEEAALDQLESYLTGPGEWSIRGLATQPDFKPMTGHPRFQALVERYGTPAAAAL